MPHTRGTSNTNARGSASARRARKLWLLETYAADVDLMDYDGLAALDDAFWAEPRTREEELWTKAARIDSPHYDVWIVVPGMGEPAVRCYRCGDLLTYDTMEVDRIKPGCEGGTYARTNIRPVCERCNKVTGAQAAQRVKARREQRRASQRAYRERASA